MGRPAGHQRPLAAQRQALAEKILDGGGDLIRFRHPAQAPFAAGHVAFLGADETDASFFQRCQVFLGRRVFPHADVHRRRHQDRLVGGHQRRRRKIVGDPGRHLGQDVGRRRRHQHQVGLAGQADMAHFFFVGEREQVLEHLVFANRAEGQRGDEFGAARSQHAAHGGAPLAKPAYQVGALISGDPTREDQQNSFTLKHFTSMPCGVLNYLTEKKCD